VKEALESNDWAQDAPSDFGEFKDADDSGSDAGDLDPENLDFGFDSSDFEGLKKAIWDARPRNEPEPGPGGAASEASAGELGDDQVVKVEKMMRKLQTVREAGQGLPEAQRKRMAARAVREVMDDL
jgi:hypothetical protein